MSKVLLDIDNSMVEEAVKGAVADALISRVGTAESLAREMVSQIFSIRVNNEGKVSSYASENKYSWIDMAIQNRMRGFAHEAFDEYLEANKDKIKKVLIEGFKKTPDKMSQAMFKAFENNINAKWMHNLTISLT